MPYFEVCSTRVIGLDEEIFNDMDGNPFELTDDEIESLGIEATEMYLDQD